METATAAIIKHLKRGRKIDQLMATEKFGTTRLSSIIYSLRNRYGMKIKTIDKRVETRRGHVSIVAEYKLEK